MNKENIINQNTNATKKRIEEVQKINKLQKYRINIVEEIWSFKSRDEIGYDIRTPEEVNRYFTGIICKNDDKLFCLYDHEIYLNYIDKYEDIISKVIIGNQKNDVPYYCAYDKSTSIKIGLRTMTLKPQDYNIDKYIYMYVEHTNKKIIVKKIPIILAIPVYFVGELTTDFFGWGMNRINPYHITI